jgi:hypothetical protein
MVRAGLEQAVDHRAVQRRGDRLAVDLRLEDPRRVGDAGDPGLHPVGVDAGTARQRTAIGVV